MEDISNIQVGNWISIKSYNEGDQLPLKVSRMENGNYFLEGYPDVRFIVNQLHPVLPNYSVLERFEFAKLKAKPEEKCIYVKEFNQNTKHGMVIIDISSALTEVEVIIDGISERYDWHWIHELQNGMKALYKMDIIP